jgi:hypothetical protein
MARPRTTHASRRDAGTKLVRDACIYLTEALGEEIVPRSTNGAKDRGDIHGLHIQGERLVVEAKNTTAMSLPQWVREAEVERENDHALAGVVLHKRKGTAAADKQWVSMTLGELVSLITLNRVHYGDPP